MIIYKSQREIELMKEAGRIVALVHQKMAEVIKPGVTTNQLDKIAYDIISSNNATPSFKGYGGFPATICASLNEVVVHGFPSDLPLVNGDIISIDVGACYKGYHGDSAWTYAVGEITTDAQQLLDVSEQSLLNALELVKPGIYLSDISNAIQVYAESYGYSLPIEFTGHGIGRDLHEDPPVPNYGLPGRGPLLKEGMTIAIEPMVNAGTRKVKVLSDGWTAVTIDSKLSAHFEHTIVVTANGYEILTKL